MMSIVVGIIYSLQKLFFIDTSNESIINILPRSLDLESFRKTLKGYYSYRLDKERMNNLDSLITKLFDSKIIISNGSIDKNRFTEIVENEGLVEVDGFYHIESEYALMYLSKILIHKSEILP